MEARHTQQGTRKCWSTFFWRPKYLSGYQIFQALQPWRTVRHKWTYCSGVVICVKLGPRSGCLTMTADTQPGMVNSGWPGSKSKHNTSPNNGRLRFTRNLTKVDLPTPLPPHITVRADSSTHRSNVSKIATRRSSTLQSSRNYAETTEKIPWMVGLKASSFLPAVYLPPSRPLRPKSTSQKCLLLVTVITTNIPLNRMAT